MNELVLVKKENFGAVECDFYRQGNEIYMTRTQIGAALEYANPNDAIRLIHNRNKERMDKFSTPFKMNGPDRNKERMDKFSVIRKIRSTDGKEYDTYFYTAKGIYEICRYSTQPKAHLFFDFVYDVLEGLRTGEYRIVSESRLLPSPDMETLIKLLGPRNASNVIAKCMVAAIKKPSIKIKKTSKNSNVYLIIKSFIEDKIEFTNNPTIAYLIMRFILNTLIIVRRLVKRKLIEYISLKHCAKLCLN